ncbi:MAG: hypothetical protein KDD63_24780, partial [Bacteroidetes bacterium]|nr:hypothetical protein [Bacteroidota bacterium]
EKSQGSLRWILLDEAHTLTGSKAAETALLIRRVTNAFGVKTKDLRFAITSATVGNGNTDVLKTFMSNLCGIEKDQVEVISGKRVNNQIPDEAIPHISDTLNKGNIKLLRDELLASSCLDQTEIGKRLGISHKSEQLKAIDILANHIVKINGQDENLLPIRGHFFTRGIGGVYVCTNRKCTEHKHYKPQNAIGTMFTVAEKNCTCGHPLLELIACRSCGNMMLEGELIKEDEIVKVSQQASTGYEAFQIEIDETDENEQISSNKNLVRFIPFNKKYEPKKADLSPINQKIKQDGQICPGTDDPETDFLMTHDTRCPHCENQNRYPIHFRISSAFTNRILSDIILDQTQTAKNPKSKTLYRGRKYISFTDSRQGTAKISALINIDSESDWIRYQTYHFLLKKLKTNQINASQDELLHAKELYLKQLSEAPPFMKKKIQEEINQIDILLDSAGKELLSQSRSTWKEIINYIKLKEDF